MKHRWDLMPKEAVALQRELASLVRIEPLGFQPLTIGGCDVSMNRFASEGYAGFVTLSYPDLDVLETSTVKAAIPFPYVPGLLSFREIPMLMAAWKILRQKPDVLMVDGIGIAHPRRIGIASHLGVLLDIPTLGCAKSVLTGTYEMPGREAGSVSALTDSRTGEAIGAAVRTKDGVNPVFVSPGHRMTIEEGVRLVLETTRGYRLPEPTRQAHMAVNEARTASSSPL
jgi:deoxyribonuclease V